MPLKFETCPKCSERHALRADGRMSIHTTEAGARCEVIETRPQPPAKKSPKKVKTKKFDASIIVARAFRARSVTSRSERTIYTGGRVSFVSGGLPGKGKRR